MPATSRSTGRQSDRDVDEVDIWGTDWAHQRRMMLGIVKADKVPSKERIGKVTCSIANLKSEREGTGSKSIRFAENGHVDRDWPEVYTGFALLVHRAYQMMPESHRTVMSLHYVWREISAREKAKSINLSLAAYWTRVAMMKSFIYGAVAAANFHKNGINVNQSDTETV
jgi:hypothetical protein